MKAQGMQKGADKVSASTIPWNTSKIFRKRQDGKKWGQTNALVTMQCCYHLMTVPIKEDEVGADEESYKTWLHHSMMPTFEKLFNFGHVFSGAGQDAMRDHNQAIVKKFKIGYKKLHADGRAWRAIRGMTGDHPFDPADYDVFQKRMREVRKCWDPANAWLDNRQGEQTRDHFRLQTFVDEGKARRLKLHQFHAQLQIEKRS